MDTISALDSHKDHAVPPVNFHRGRRWSLDVISPKKLFSRKESIQTAGPIVAVPKLDPPPKRERRFSSPNIKGFKLKPSHRFFHHHHHEHKENKESYLVMYSDNQQTHVITCKDEDHIKSVLSMMDECVHSYRLIVPSTKMAPKIDLGLIRRWSKSSENLVETTNNEEDEDDDEYDDDEDKENNSVTTVGDESNCKQRIVNDMLDTENEYLDNLQILYSSYCEPIRNLSYLSKGDDDVMFMRIQPILSLSTSLIQELKSALEFWDKDSTQIGSLFSSTFWNIYEDYSKNFCEAERLVNTHNGCNSPFLEFCENNVSQGTQSLLSLLTLPVTRITDYGKYLSDLLNETDSSHPDFVDLSMAVTRANSMIRDRDDTICNVENNSVMDVEKDKYGTDDSPPHLHITTTINNNNNNNNYTSDSVFINDSINNNNNNISTDDKDKSLNKNKGISLRRMSAPSALLFKSLAGYKSKGSNSLWSNNSISKKDQDLISHFKMADVESTRMFVMEGSVQLAAGMQIQERYLFLFNDLLLVTKQKSSTAFKLKHKVQLSDMWLAFCIEEVAETTRPTDRSFVLGWPTLNVVATFGRPDIKDYWLTKLKEYIQVEKLKRKDKEISLRVAPRDINATSRTQCQVTINNETEAKDVLLACLNQLNISEHESKDYQLWVLSGKEGSPYPLIGHETPFSIKLCHFRGLSRSRSGDNIDNMTAADLESVITSSASTSNKCEFYLKQKKSIRKNFEESLSKSGKKTKKSQNIFHTLFRKRRPAESLVFGLPLSDVCDENLDPPESIIRLMVLVYQQGPRVPGILRRGNKAALSKEIREKINSGDKYTLEDHYAPTAASVFKEFLRSIPGGLLMNDLYPLWATIRKDDSCGDKLNKIRIILAKLPPANYRMLKLTVSLLQHLAKFRSQNQMGPSNLATCIAPSLYTRGASHGSSKGESLKQIDMQDSVSQIQNVIVPLISFMIVNHIELFGEDILSLFTKYNCKASPAMKLQEDGPEIQLQPSVEEDEEELAAEEEQDDGCFSEQHPKKHHRMQLQHEMVQRDSNSGTDSDSIHSVLSMQSIQETDLGLRHNDSSIDSLVDRDFYLHEAESSPKAVKSHVSPSNLSRDSGLTLSDSQLYDEETSQGEIINVPIRIYQRSSSQCTESGSTETFDQIVYYPNVGNQFVKSGNPVAPPRKRVPRRGRDSNNEISVEQQGFITYYRHHAPLNHSFSTTQLETNSKFGRSGDCRALLSHPLLSQKVSSDSIGEESETMEDPFQPIDFEKMRGTTDIGTVVKSENGSDLFLNEQTVPVKYSLNVAESKSQHRFVRQSSVTDTTPPVSPHSRYSQSSHDSAISDSVYSGSQDESFHSAPQTPEKLQDKTLTWVPDIAIPEKPWAGKLLSNISNNQHNNLYSKSTSDLLSDKETSPERNLFEQGSKVQLLSPKVRPGKFHEAEEIEINTSCSTPKSFLTDTPPKSYSTDTPPNFPKSYSTDTPLPLSLSSQSENNLPYSRHRLPNFIDKGSPPPNVIMQTLQNLPRKDCTSFKFNNINSTYDSANNESFGPIMNSVRFEEYRNVTSKPIIIEPSLTDSLSAVASRRARLSKYMASSSIDLPTSSKDNDFILSDSKRPDKPPNYQQAVERNQILKQKMTPDRVHANAVAESEKINCEQTKFKFNETRTPFITNASNSLSNAKLYEEPAKEVTSNRANMNCVECSVLRHSSKDTTEDSPQNGKNFGYLDNQFISNNVQKDVTNGSSVHADSSTSNNKSSFEKFLSSSTNDSKLSCALSRKENLATNILPSKHSNVLEHHQADISKGTLLPHVSKNTFSKNPSMTSTFTTNADSDSDQRSTPYSRYFSPVKHDQSNQFITLEENEEVNLKEDRIIKDPQKLYFQSKQIYEQNNFPVGPELSSPLKKPLSPANSSPLPNSYQLLSSCTSSKLLSDKTSNLSSQNINVHKPSPLSTSHIHRSASVDHLNKFGGNYNSRTNKAVQKLFQNGQFSNISLPTSKFAPENNNSNVKERLQPIVFKSELHQKFIHARSCFSHPQNDQPTSSYLTNLDDNKDKKVRPRAQTTEDMPVESALISSLRTTSSKLVSSPLSSLSETKKEIHWSVKELKTIYDKSKEDNIQTPATTDNSPHSRDPSLYSSSQSQQCKAPCDNSQPSRRVHDTSNSSISTTGSRVGDNIPKVSLTSSKNSNLHKLGPQNCVYDTMCSFSSSEDICSSSLNRSSRSGNSSLDSEELSDYTNITYV